MTPTQHLFNKKEAAEFLGIGLSTLYRYQKMDDFPKPIIYKNQTIRFKRDDLEAFMYKRQGGEIPEQEEPLKPKYDELSEEDFYLGFLSIVKAHHPNLIEALSKGKTSKQTDEALEVALNFYDTSLEIVKELCKLRDENKRLMNALKNSTKGDVK